MGSSLTRSAPGDEVGWKWFVQAEMRLRLGVARRAADGQTWAVFARALQKWHRLPGFLFFRRQRYQDGLVAGAFLERQQHALDDHFVEAHGHELLVGARAE